MEQRGGYWGRYGPAVEEEAAAAAAAAWWAWLTEADGRLWGSVPKMKCVWWAECEPGWGVCTCPGWVWECAWGWGWEWDRVRGCLVTPGGPPQLLPPPLRECVGAAW